MYYPDLEGKSVVVTGAGSGIGRAAAVLFARNGARLMLGDRSQDGLNGTAELLPKDAEYELRTLDVSQEPEVEALISDTVSRYGRLDVLCNNAGVTGGYADVTEQDVQDWQWVLGVNLIGPMLTTKYAARHMRERGGGGAIVNTASVAGIRSGAGGNAYSASKAGLINFTMTSACDLGGDNIRVNAVCPGLTRTGMTQRVFDYAAERGKMDKVGSRAELRRYAEPEEIAAVLVFLASEQASFVTGQALPVDGGNTASLNMPGMKV